MSRNFSVIFILKEDVKDDNFLQITLDKLKPLLKKDKTNLTEYDLEGERIDRYSERLIGISDNERVLYIDDLYDLISQTILTELSGLLNTEIVRFINSDTACVAGISISRDGKLIRQEFYEEEKDENTIGERTKYEIGSMISNFEELREVRLIPLEKEIHFNLYKEIENKQ
jgi:hypothetical protein